jgi:hypothetical protein
MYFNIYLTYDFTFVELNEVYDTYLTLKTTTVVKDNVTGKVDLKCSVNIYHLILLQLD